LTDRAARVRLEALDERWLDDVAALITDPEVLRFTRIPEPPPAGFEEGWVQSYATARRDGTRAGFAATDDGGRFLGLALAPHVDREAGEIELGYIVAREARGRGVATAILSLLTRWAFDEGHAQRVYLIIDVDNHASLRVAERCGYRREGVMRSIHVKQGQRADVELWSRLPTDPPWRSPAAHIHS
jgi:RimJ/RimL family protein N-acetyltransferase